MAYERYSPIDPRDAFTVTAHIDSETTQDAAASQAALLLSLRSGMLGREVDGLPEFQLPKLQALRRSRRMSVAEACRELGTSEKELDEDRGPILRREMSRLVRRLYERPSVEAAAALFEGAMFAPHPLVAVAGAIGARETTRLRPRIQKLLSDCVDSDHALVARLARAAVGQIPAMTETNRKYVIKQPKSRKRRRRSETAVVTHGTWAANGTWWKPGGDYYDALDAKRPDLHVHDTSFRWTGSYSHAARAADAALLQQWISDQGLVRPDFFAHSHGGTVAHLATARGVELERLVLMAWPVHEQWFPVFSRVTRIIDVRVKLDLVILVDGGGQRFRTSQLPIEEHRNGWFDHSSTHEPSYWDDHGLWGVI